MSVWSEAHGRVWIKRNSGYALQDGLRAIYDEVIWKSEQSDAGNGRVCITFWASISLENMAAARVFQQWLDEIKAADKRAEIDFVANIRFLD